MFVIFCALTPWICSLQWLSIPFAMTHSAVSSISDTSTQWVGEWSNTYVGVWLDYALLLVNTFLFLLYYAFLLCKAKE